MVNLIKKNCFPDKQEFIQLYINHSQSELAIKYMCSKLRIRKWIHHFGLKPRQKGGGNNRKYQPCKEVLRTLIDGCASVENLQIISWEENLKKRKFGGTK